MARLIRSVGPVAVVLAVLVAGLHAAEVKFGAGVKLTAATSIKDIYASPERFVGKTVRLDGVVTAVCDEMGCWLAIADAGAPDRAVRFQAEHDGSIVFPLTLKGKPARAEGVFVRIGAGDKEAQEAAREHAASQPKAADFGNRYEIKVTGAVAP